MEIRSDLGGDPFRKFKQTKFFSSLDGLRAVAIAAVIWHHSGSAPHVGLLGQGNRGVTLFFAISGFLIVTLILRAKDKPGGFSLPAFWGRRALRILPAYYAVLALYALVVVRMDHDAGSVRAFFGNLPAFATFTSNWFVDLNSPRVIFYFAWSLAAEEQFYLTWPIVERYCRGMVAVGVAVAVLVLTRALSMAAGPAGRAHLLVRIPCSIPPAIVLGVFFAHLLHSPRTFRLAYAVLGRRGSAAGCAALALGTVALFGAKGDAGECAVSAALALLVTACAIREDNDLAGLLRLRSIAWVGTVSYSMYLLHMLCEKLAADGLAALHAGGALMGAAALFALILATGLASLSYVTYERFFLSLKTRLFGEPRTG